ncbi:B12-binding domain-containing radical SAM protein [Candidatus Omnitrophota bacterium]
MLIDLIRVPDPTCIDDLLDEPLGLMYLAACLRVKGYQVRITNLAGHSFESCKNEIKEADLYGIQLYTPTSKIGIGIAKFIKEKFPGKPLICGGAHPSALPESEELEIFDNVVIGEGEISIVKIVDAYRDKKKIPRIIRSDFIKDLDSMPLPAWDMVEMMRFHRKVDGERCFGVIGSRGCSFRCAFCDQAIMGGKVRFRSIDNIVYEIKEALKRYGVRHFEFFDDMFTVRRSRLLEFKEKTKGLDLSYRCNGRTDILTKDTYELLRESGCKVVCFGIESGSQKILDRMVKQNSVENSYKAIKMAQEAGLTVIGYFMIGFPGETIKTINESMEFVEKSNLDQAQFYTFVPLPGCDVYRHPEKYDAKITSHDFSDYYLVTGKDGLGGKTVETETLSADELRDQMKRIRKFLKGRGFRGKTQDYYKNKLKYKEA